MIWWDFFANKLVGNRWSTLDEYVPGPRTPDECTVEELKAGLMICGYPEAEATRRSMERKTFGKRKSNEPLP
jgi:hypothetical protein